MMRLFWLFVITAWSGAAPASETAATAALKPLAFLANSCWEGTFPDGKTVDIHCGRWIQNGAYYRETNELRNAPTPYYGEATYYYDYEAKSVRYIYFAVSGGYATGLMDFQDGALKFYDEKYFDSGQTLLLRTERKQLDMDHFIARSESFRDGKWIEEFSVTYSRRPFTE